jgi:hypothetical protein
MRGRDKAESIEPFGRRLEAAYDERDIGRNTALAVPCDLSTRQGISALMRSFQSHADVEARDINGRQLVRIPFRDIILRGQRDHMGSAELRLLDQLTFSLSEWRRDFRVRSFPDPLLDGQRMAYFGFGVFAPSGHDTPVTDLEFSLDVEAGPIAQAWLDGDKTVPAAWYDGQAALAVAFTPGVAAAVVDPRDLRPRAHPETLFDGDLTLFIGRSSANDAPEIRAFRRPATAGSARSVKPPSWLSCHANAGWWRDTRWQPVQVRDPEGRPPEVLWIRLSDRTGSVPFVADTDRLHEKGRAIRVRGLVVPDLSVTSLMRADAARRWWVDFDESARLRTTELAPRRVSMVSTWGNRLALYHHRSGTSLPGGSNWEGLESTINGMQMLRLPRDTLVDVEWLNPATMGITPKQRAAEQLERFYSHSQSAVVLTDGGQQFGWMPLPSSAVAYRVISDPCSVGDALRAEAAQNGVGVLSLDWLNRAGKVDTGRIVGLAERWFHGPFGLREILLEPTATELRVTVSEGGQGIGGTRVEYAIPAGRDGLLGPLYVQYQSA